MIKIIFLIIFAWALQHILTIFQIKHFNKEYRALRKKGFVLVGKQSSRFSKGCVILLLITKEGNILQGKIMSGYTTFTRFKNMTYVINKNIIDNWDNEKISIVIKKALCNARQNFLKEIEMLNTKNHV